jgi:hypothetical protein
MNRMFRSLVAVVAGVVASFVIIAVVEFVSNRVFPTPPGTDLNNPQALRDAASRVPTGAMVLVMTGWGLGTFVGAWLAARISGWSPVAHGMMVGSLFILATIANLIMIPHPGWVWAVSLPILPALAYFGAILAVPRVRASDVPGVSEMP